MGLVTGGALAAAVSRAGGLGIVGGAYAGTLGGEPDLETELAEARSEKFGVGFVTWSLVKARDILPKALRYSRFCVFLSFGDPRPFAAHSRFRCPAHLPGPVSVADRYGPRSRRCCRSCQGTEAGEHAATRSTFAFVPEAADYLKRPSPETLLRAAGAIADGRGLAAALMLGADGVVVGSRFLVLGRGSHSEAAHRQSQYCDRRFDHSYQDPRRSAGAPLGQGSIPSAF